MMDGNLDDPNSWNPSSVLMSRIRAINPARADTRATGAAPAFGRPQHPVVQLAQRLQAKPSIAIFIRGEGTRDGGNAVHNETDDLHQFEMNVQSYADNLFGMSFFSNLAMALYLSL